MIHEGDVVIVHEDNTPRIQWRLTVVEELIMGNDDHIRAAHIRPSHTTTRPVAKLYKFWMESKVSPLSQMMLKYQIMKNL